MADLERLIHIGVYVFVIESAVGTALAIVHLVDGAFNLRASRGLGPQVRGSAWLWLGFAAVSFVGQAKLLTIGMLTSGSAGGAAPSPAGLVLVPTFIVAAAGVLAIQIAVYVGRRHVRSLPPPRELFRDEEFEASGDGRTGRQG